MFKWLTSKLEPYIRQIFMDAFRQVLYEADKEKRYMMFLPTDINEKELREAIKPFKDKIDLVIIQADDVTILEF
jgi:hypothetical protein